MVLLFFGPMFVATIMYFSGNEAWRPSGSVAHGVLLSDPKTLPEGALTLPGGGTVEFGGKWTLLYVGSGDCDAACKETLYRTRQVRRSMGKENLRIQRAYVATSGTPDPDFIAAEHSGLAVIADGAESRELVLAALGEFAEGDVFVADPLGNVILRFAPATEMKDMHADLKLLLNASQIG